MRGEASARRSPLCCHDGINHDPGWRGVKRNLAHGDDARTPPPTMQFTQEQTQPQEGFNSFTWRSKSSLSLSLFPPSPASCLSVLHPRKLSWELFLQPGRWLSSRHMHFGHCLLSTFLPVLPPFSLTVQMAGVRCTQPPLKTSLTPQTRKHIRDKCLCRSKIRDMRGKTRGTTLMIVRELRIVSVITTTSLLLPRPTEGCPILIDERNRDRSY
jgi:hypothetical protein